jgi:hypothetical protein
MTALGYCDRHESAERPGLRTIDGDDDDPACPALLLRLRDCRRVDTLFEQNQNSERREIHFTQEASASADWQLNPRYVRDPRGRLRLGLHAFVEMCVHRALINFRQ